MARGTIKVNSVAHRSSISSVLHSTLPFLAEQAIYNQNLTRGYAMAVAPTS